MQDSSSSAINYINSSLYKCIHKTAAYGYGVVFTCTRPLYPRESVTRIYFGERDQAAVLRLSQHHSLTIVRSYSDDDRQAEASNCGVWLLYELVAHAGPCGRVARVGVENAADQARGGHERNATRACVCVGRRRSYRGGQLPNCGAPRDFTIICLRHRDLQDRLALHD